MTYTQAMYRAKREEFLQRLLAALGNDERFVAAWLTGSLAQGDGDEISDLDLSIVVADSAREAFCACGSEASAGNSSPTRQALYEQFGEPLVLYEAPSWLGDGSCFNHVSYRETALVVDWVFMPQASAQRPVKSRVLFDKVEIAVTQEEAVSLEERQRSASRTVGYFWLMTTVTLKYLLRHDTVAFYGFISTLYWAIQDVKKALAGADWQYKRVDYPLVGTVQQQIVLIRQFCEEMLTLMPQVVQMGGTVPDDPMSVIEVWLSMVEDDGETASGEE